MTTSTPHIAIVGLGHIGAPLAVAFARAGHVYVHGVDRQPARLDVLTRRDASLDDDLREGLELACDNLELGERLERVCDAIIIAIEPSHVGALLELVAEYAAWLVEGGVMMIASTCRPEWFSSVASELDRARGGAVGERVHLAHVPERLMPGKALSEVVGLPRVIGGYTPECGAKAAALYGEFMQAEAKVVSLEAAALAKIAENAYRAVNIVLANELADVSARYGLDPTHVAQLANTHPRVNVHAHGAGAWGRCLPLALDMLSQEGSTLAEVASELNAARPEVYVREVHARLEGVERPVVVVAGVAYKANQGDARFSAGAVMVEALRGLECEVRACDPCVNGWPEPLYDDLIQAVSGAHAVIVTVGHAAFTEVSVMELEQRMCEPGVIVDVVGCLK